ncbi:hypothetical protein RhiirA4_452775 [Rhizophagus irregularis]|uniref:Uncharacterized protein n=1 Tax=Rhizophagus irregularis TaxID=588596 RepID=A0A2I1FYX0_9GLOM|nr:hypothetical protein RhiirA4_452775 [Rhizophagus irregularis]
MDGHFHFLSIAEDPQNPLADYPPHVLNKNIDEKSLWAQLNKPFIFGQDVNTQNIPISKRPHHYENSSTYQARYQNENFKERFESCKKIGKHKRLEQEFSDFTNSHKNIFDDKKQYNTPVDVASLDEHIPLHIDWFPDLSLSNSKNYINSHKEPSVPDTKGKRKSSAYDRVNKKFDGIDSLAPGLPRLIHQKTIIKNIQHLPAKFYRNHLPPPNYQEKILQKNVIILGKIRREKYHLKQLAKCEAHAQFLEQQEEAELREMQEAIMEMGNHKPPPPDPEYQRELTKLLVINYSKNPTKNSLSRYRRFFGGVLGVVLEIAKAREFMIIEDISSPPTDKKYQYM